MLVAPDFMCCEELSRPHDDWPGTDATCVESSAAVAQLRLELGISRGPRAASTFTAVSSRRTE